MIFLKLFWAFFKIGMFSFGGGYVMIPLIQREIETNQWLDPRDFADIVAISQMTPGPLAVNAATYVGVKVAGIAGSFFATLGVSLPSFILVILVAKFFMHFKENSSVNSVLKGIRPVTVGMMAAAVLFFAEMSIFTKELPLDKLNLVFTQGFPGPFKDVSINPGAIVIFIIVLLGTKRFKLHPIPAVLLSAILGVFIA